MTTIMAISGIILAGILIFVGVATFMLARVTGQLVREMKAERETSEPASEPATDDSSPPGL